MCREKIPSDRQRNRPKHVEFYYKNKIEKLVHLFGYIIRIYHDARSPERQKNHFIVKHSICAAVGCRVCFGNYKKFLIKFNSVNSKQLNL